MIPKIGPSTVAGLTGIAVVLAAFCTTWAEGNPSTALAAIAAALTALVGALRSWQAVSATKGTPCDTESEPPA